MLFNSSLKLSNDSVVKVRLAFGVTLFPPQRFTSITLHSPHPSTPSGKFFLVSLNPIQGKGLRRLFFWRGAREGGSQAPATSLFEPTISPIQGLKEIIWVGLPTARPSIDVWRYYLRRFCVDHWYRFAKGCLHWTMPKLKTPQQAERWSCLMPAITWQLWLARDGIGDRPLPWQKPQSSLISNPGVDLLYRVS